MAWDWLKRKGGVDEVDPDLEPDAAESLLCRRGSDATILVATADEPHAATIHGTVAIVDDNRLVITNTGGAEKPADDATVTLQWPVDTGLRHVAVTVASTTPTAWNLVVSGDVVHEQRRRWIRVRTNLPVFVRLPEQEEWLSGNTINLSAGGMAAVLEATNGQLNAPAKVDIRLNLPDGALTLTGTVSEIIEDEPGSMVRADFSEVEEACHERLAAHVFHVQREELARRRQQGAA
ncbi:PilZ domain-containing protein [Krasilnikovia cinnamomea]|uniref:PilZ domain-containing protein n=1 Tax=Krasilnikovia cinnamomea TaxID=349313 RepID=A0A4Q7ZU11_9ACTN|nr:PilZ domain-containing protein [Krasilnikovia cinnamomea]RZU54444.1 PilZ domain-containing protein [Krasilnikovia cinnamomea]